MRIYWTAWLLMVSIVMIICLFNFFESQRGSIAAAYMLSSSMPLMFILGIEGYRGNEYLKKHHREKWNELTYSSFMKTSGFNTLKGLKFYYSDDDLGDPKVAALRSNSRKLWTLAWTVFVTMPLIMMFIATDNLSTFLSMVPVVIVGMLIFWGLPIYIFRRLILKIR